MTPAFLYRCEDRGEHVYVHRFRVIGVTARGVRIDDFCGQKWVSLHTRKRYAHPTQEEAVKSFAARKNRQIAILAAQLERVRKASRIPSSEYLLCWQ
jgi:hypothetical protein